MTTGICFALTLFITPIAAMIPSEATAPALILIGLLMITGVKDIDFNDFTESFPAFATKELNWGIYVLAIPLLLYFVI